MIIDCETCTAGPRACGDCIVTHLLSAGRPQDHGQRHPHGITDLTAGEMVAVGVLAAGGLVPPLRLVPGRPRPAAIECVESDCAPQQPPETLGTGARAG